MEIVNFTPVPALIGGALIGLSAAFLLWSQGRIAGISGIVGGLTKPVRGDLAWRAVFLIGLVLGGVLYRVLGFGVGVDHIQPVVSPTLLVLAGLLVGVGATIGAGCTSGHGICGLARRSPRSLVATLSFMGSGLVTVFVVRQLMGVGA
ncbi:YeeE/YedE family protein [Saccharospirillum sp. MSK14-1]|uniref:YeeE/YedE family protein n=1 Tax=Saccharospirillum sp. MSK14-1 TaxID=1897632 RepID=UPI000D358A42|nr:YeeE/YedE thiosulfate transporter family protein [Saccharospirillum sp. MSK14-1]PTY35979.1 YeeE/YedE family protein [Saccharospirillum sp. MSK14-1]